MAAAPKKISTKSNQFDPHKRFNNGIKTLGAPESNFLKEIYNKDAQKQDKFREFSHILKKPRNPTLGELTSREDAEYLLPFQTSFSNTLEEKRLEEQFKNSNNHENDHLQLAKFITDVEKVTALRSRREALQAELDTVKKTMKHQQLCMTVMGGGTQTLHPALNQTSKMDNSTASLVKSTFKKY